MSSESSSGTTKNAPQESSKMSQKIQVEPHHIFGLRRETKNNLLFSDEQTVIFPSGKYCVHYDIHKRWTKFILGAMPDKQGPEVIQALTVCPNQRYLAVSECREQGIITVYDLQNEQCTKRQVLTGGSKHVREFICMAFSGDSKYLLGQSKGPEWTLFYWEWEKDEVIATVKTTRLGFVSQVSFNPKDSKQVCVSGNYVFKIFRLENNTLNQTSLTDMDLENVMSHAWVAKDSIVLGTETGKLLLLKAGHWHKLERPTERMTVRSDPDGTASPTDTLPSITAITAYSKGFACASRYGLVNLYRRIGEYGYEETTEIRIPQDPCSIQSEQQEIATMSMSPSEETLAISTCQGQIYKVNLASIELSKSKQAKFEFLFHSVHSGSITGLSTCASKPLFATCSKDNSVRIWSYKTKSLELYKEFPEEPNCISLHPNSLSVLVGFSDKVCFMYPLVDGFRTVQEFNILHCNECVFNHDGNVFAAVSDNLINICSLRTGEKVELSGHTNKVLQVKWSEDDRSLVSCGMDGIIYEWNALTGAHESKDVQNVFTYMHATFLPNAKRILAVGKDSSLHELRDGEIVWEMASDGMAYTALSMTHSGQAVFIGTEDGTVRVMQYPLDKTKSWTEHQAHSGPITQMAVTPDDQYLLTASENGSLLIWMIADQEGRKLSTPNIIDYTEEFLCTKDFLQKKDQSILEAYAQVELLKKEQECKLNQTRVDYEEKMNKVQQSFLQQIEVLNIEKEEQRIINEELKASQEKTLTEMMEKHAEDLQIQLKSLEDSERISKTFEWEQRFQALQQSFEEKLYEQEDNRFRTTMDMRQSYEDRLQDQQEKLQQSEEKLKELQEKAESEFKDIFLRYGHKLQVEKETSTKLENEMKLMEKQMIQLWKIKGELQEQSLEISQLETKVEEINSEYKEVTEKLNQKLKIKERQLFAENMKVRNLKATVQRMKADIQNCSSFLHQPKMLKKNFKKLQKFYVHGADVSFGFAIVQEHTKLRMVVSQEPSQTIGATNQETPVECSSILMQQVEVKQEVNDSEVTQAVTAKNDETEPCDICHVYKRELQAEKKTSSNLKYEMELMENQVLQFWKIKGDIHDQRLEISMLKEEVQSLYDQHNKERTVENLKKEKEEHNKTILDQEADFQDIVEMHEKSSTQNEEDLISINRQLDELFKEQKRQTRETTETQLKQLQSKIRGKKQIYEKLKAEMEEICIMRMETIYGMKEKLNLKEQELCTEKQKVRNMINLVERIKADIQNCTNFILQPRLLRENFMKLHNSYIQDVKVRAKAGNMQEPLRKKGKLQKTAAPQMKSQVTADYATILNQGIMPAKEFIQEREKIPLNCSSISDTTKTVLNDSTPSSRDSRPKSGREPMTLPQLPCARNQWPMMDIQDMGQHQVARWSSLGGFKLPFIESTKNTR